MNTPGHDEAPTDALIDRVLQNFSTAAPPAGLEARTRARLLQQLEASPTTMRQTRRFVRRASWHHGRAYIYAVSACAAALLMVVLLHRSQPVPTLKTVSEPSSISSVGTHTPFVSIRPSGRRAAMGRPQTVSLPPPASAQPQLSPDELALQEATAASRPAPMLPITREERLIQRFSERHSAISLAALTPPAQFAHERAEQEDYNSFFSPPPSPLAMSGDSALNTAAPESSPATAAGSIRSTHSASPQGDSQ